MFGKWKACTKCSLCTTRRRVVIGRGDVPAKILFIGEAPGKSEDLRGLPFAGPSGRILRMAMEDALELSEVNEIPSFYITNTIGCRPPENRKPTQEEMTLCWERVQDVVCKVRPETIVTLGKTAEMQCKKAFPELIALQHPAYILRTGGCGYPPYQQMVRQLSEVFDS
jgi:uracil-DNA glycosylase family 4